MLEISPQGPSGLSGKICLCGIGAAGTKVMEEVLLLAPQSVRWKAARWPSLPPGWEGERDPA